MPDLRNRLPLLVAALILVPVLLYWGFSGSPGELSRKPSGKINQQIDYFVNQAKVTEWKTDGQLLNTLHSKRVEHHPQQAHNQLTKPVNYRHRENQPPVRITADRGITLDDNSRTDLAGNVQVHDNPDSEHATIMRTEALSIFTQDNYATSDQRVTITSPDGMQTGIGMHADFDSRTMTLHSRVEGRYDNEQ